MCSRNGRQVGSRQGNHTGCADAGSRCQEGCRHRCSGSGGSNLLHNVHTYAGVVQSASPACYSPGIRSLGSLWSHGAQVLCSRAGCSARLHVSQPDCLLLCAAGAAVKTAADKAPAPPAPALPSSVPQPAQALKDAVPDLSAVFKDAAKDGETGHTCKGPNPVLCQGLRYAH